MKKTYLQPEVAITEMEMEQILVASDLTVDIDSETSESPEAANARMMFLDVLLVE